MNRYAALVAAITLNFSTYADALESARVTTIDVQALICQTVDDSVNIFDSYVYELPATNETIQKLNDEGRCATLTVQIDASRLKRCEAVYEDCRGFPMEYKGVKYYVTLFPPFEE